MRTVQRAVLIAVSVLCAASAFAKEKTKPKIAPLHDRASVTCPLNYPDELRAAHEIEGAAIYPIEGADVAKFLAIFNAAEPKTDFKADRALVAVNARVAYVELFEGGCVTHSGPIAPASFDEMMGQAFGGELPDATAM